MSKKKAVDDPATEIDDSLESVEDATEAEALPDDPAAPSVRVVPVAALESLSKQITAIAGGDSHRHRFELAKAALEEIDRIVG